MHGTYANSIYTDTMLNKISCIFEQMRFYMRYKISYIGYKISYILCKISYIAYKIYYIVW